MFVRPLLGVIWQIQSLSDGGAFSRPPLIEQEVTKLNIDGGAGGDLRP